LVLIQKALLKDYITFNKKYNMYCLSFSSSKCIKALLAITFLAQKLAEVVSHLLSLYNGTMYPSQASAHPPV